MNVQSIYARSLPQIANAIRFGGHLNTTLVQGHIGTGKSSILKLLADMLPSHTPCYFDCTTKDLGDIMLPRILDTGINDNGYVRYATNEELGLHINKPITLMIDEYGKANPSVKNSLLRVMQERKMGHYELHPDSIVFATTNLGGEGVGDLLPAHARNRITILTMRKPTNMEWIEWGINNDIDHTLLGWCKDNPQVFNSYEDHKSVEENPYIYFPKSPAVSFVTPRSLEKASHWMKLRHNFDEQTLVSILMGVVGNQAALDLVAFTGLADRLPTLESIKKTPKTALVPDKAAAVCMVVYRTLASLESSWVDAWMEYMVRLDKEAQGMFVNAARAASYGKRDLVLTNAKFGKWALAHGYLFAADK